MMQMNGEIQLDKEKVKQKNVKIFYGTENFQGGYRKRSSTLSSRKDLSYYVKNKLVRVQSNINISNCLFIEITVRLYAGRKLVKHTFSLIMNVVEDDLKLGFPFFGQTNMFFHKDQP